MTRVIHTLLTRAQISHICKAGSLSLDDVVVPVHWWIEVYLEKATWIVDYRSRIWLLHASDDENLASAADEGIFKRATTRSRYDGRDLDLSVLDDEMLQIMLTSTKNLLAGNLVDVSDI